VTVTFHWRGPFESAEVSELRADAFHAGARADSKRSWTQILARHSLGWVVARDEDRLVGFVNVAWDGCAHAWIQDVMVAHGDRREGIGTEMIAKVREEGRKAGCEWLHVDFEEGLGEFYFQSCGFTPTTAGLIRLS
jgi:GNAT superfamily N-acetyltransferase